jgi:hypothetical protein
MSLKNFTILFSINILLTIVCIATIYFLGSSDRSFVIPGSILDGLFIFFIITQLYITFRVLKIRGIYSSVIYAICVLGIFAIWFSFFLYFIRRMQS